MAANSPTPQTAAAIKFERDCETSGGYVREERDSVVAAVLERAVSP